MCVLVANAYHRHAAARDATRAALLSLSLSPPGCFFLARRVPTPRVAERAGRASSSQRSRAQRRGEKWAGQRRGTQCSARLLTCGRRRQPGGPTRHGVLNVAPRSPLVRSLAKILRRSSSSRERHSCLEVLGLYRVAGEYAEKRRNQTHGWATKRGARSRTAGRRGRGRRASSEQRH